MQPEYWMILICGSALLILALVSKAGRSSGLDSIKGKTVGDGQHGTARFAKPEEIQRMYHQVRFTPCD